MRARKSDLDTFREELRYDVTRPFRPVFLLIQLDLRGFVFLDRVPVAANLDNEKLSA
ncbi:MAG: hypothetical protein LAP86_08280 [Acidobacteriia bacterium]|nr:hypothetical protein [Terriglobia bacterium]